jgi:hypothetical protein
MDKKWKGMTAAEKRQARYQKWLSPEGVRFEDDAPQSHYRTFSQASLQESHYIPAGIHRRLRETDQKNLNPYAITKKAAVQTSKQKTAFLLCSDCENRISKYGGNWVLAHSSKLTTISLCRIFLLQELPTWRRTKVPQRSSTRQPSLKSAHRL